MRSTPFSSVLLAATVACGGGKPSTPSVATPASAPAPAAAPAEPTAPTKPVATKSLAAIGLDPDALDRAADPCDDFYQFACGGWIRKTEIPADKPLAMRSFVAIDDRNVAYEHDLLEKLRTTPGDDPAARQLGAYYGSCMDEAAIAQAGLAPLQPLLAAIERVKDVRSLTTVIAAQHLAGLQTLFVLAPIQDAADARNVIAGIDQGGIGLPDRDYYLNDDEQSKALRAAYQGYVENLLGAIGHKAAKQEAADILALETEIAKVSKDKVARRDPKGNYNKIDRAGVAKAMPAFAWEAFWAAVGLKTHKDVTVTSPEFLAGVDKLLASTRPATWRSYLAFHVTHSLAPALTQQLEEIQFKLVSMLSGQPQMEPRWKRCVRLTATGLGQQPTGGLPDLVAQMFVRDRFAGASKAAAEDLVHAISGAMSTNLDALTWMDPTTKSRAKTKLAAMSYQIGYPRKWNSYPFKVDRKTWAANAIAANRAYAARELTKIGKPVDKDDWEFPAQEVNAYYNPQLNGMVFPAGILQPPFYSVEFAVPVNLGGMGVVVGHELTHGFDDQGAQYDDAGNLASWWQPDTERQFVQRTQCVIEQYSRYEVVGGTKLNGANTVGENIADIGGVKLSLAAARQLRASAPEATVADGFTEDQQFFLGFGQAWCAKFRPELEKLLATIDVHSPAKWRVNGALQATPDFAAAFHCKAGSKMVPAKQCVVW